MICNKKCKCEHRGGRFDKMKGFVCLVEKCDKEEKKEKQAEKDEE